MNFVFSIIAAVLIREQVNEFAHASSILANDFTDWVGDVKGRVSARLYPPPTKKPKSAVRLKWEKILSEKK